MGSEERLKGSFIVPTLNAEKTIESCLDSVFAQNPYEVIAVDSGSTDRTLEIMKSKGVKIIKGPTSVKDRSRKVVAFNLGIKAASGDIIIIVNQDTILEKDWWQKIRKHYEDEEVVGVGGFIVHTGNDYNWIFNGEVEKGYRTDLFGWAYSFRRNVALEVGGFDEEIWGDIRNPNEDTELCFRMLKKGMLFLDTDAIGVHVHPIRSFRELVKKYIAIGQGQAIAVSRTSVFPRRAITQSLLIISFLGFWLKTYESFLRLAKKFSYIYRPKKPLIVLSFYKTICYWFLMVSRIYYLLKYSKGIWAPT